MLVTRKETLKATLRLAESNSEKLKNYKSELSETLGLITYALYGEDVRELKEIAKCWVNLIEAQSKYVEKLKKEAEKQYQEVSEENKKRLTA